MKPIFNESQRLLIIMYDCGYKTMMGAILKLELAWRKMIREMHESLININPMIIYCFIMIWILLVLYILIEYR
jgi:hypothetical protein